MRLFSAALAAAAGLAFAGTAQAAQLLQATLTGTITPGAFDFDNRLGYGVTFSALDLRAFTIKAIYDPTVGLVVNTGGAGEGRRGGDTFPIIGPNPVQSVSFTVDGGNTINFAPDQRSDIRNLTGLNFNLFLQDRIGGGPAYDDFSFSAYYAAASGHLNQVLDLTNVISGVPGKNSGGAMILRGADSSTRVNVNMQLRTLQITSFDAPAGVPEPAAWALMIVGFGGVGAALRARRRTALAA